MYPVPAPPSSSLPEEEKEHHEKTPVFKKVMDKVKRMKKAIRKKTHGHSNGGDVDDHLQDGELDEGDEEYEEDEEIKEDPAVHDVPKYESPAIGATTGAKENSVGGGDPPTTESKTNISRGGEREGAEGVGDGLGMINEESVEDSGLRGTEGEGNLGIEQSRGFPSTYESPATGEKTGANDISGGGGEGVERVNDGMADAEMNTRNEQSRDSPFNMPGELEGANGVDDFVKNPASPRIDDETDTRNEESQVYESSAKGAKIGANELLGVETAKGVDDGSGLNTKDFVENQATPRTNDETDTRIEQSQAYESPSTGAKIGVNDISGGGGEVAERVNDGMADAEMNTRNEHTRDSPFNMSGGLEGAKGVDHFVKNPTSYDEMDTRNEESQVYESPAAKTGANDILEGGREDVERVNDGMADAEMNTRNEQSRDSPFNMSGGLEGAKGVDHFVKDPASPMTDDETNTRNEESQGAKTEANELVGVESVKGVDDSSGLITKDFVENPATLRTNDETDTRIEQSQVYESPATGTRIGANDILGGGREDVERVNDGIAYAETNTMNDQSRDSPFNMSGGLEGAKGVNHFVKDPPRTDDEMDTRNEQTQVYESSATDVKTGANELLGVESVKGVHDGSGLITKDFVENPATPRTNDETDTRIEESRVQLSPTAGGARVGVNEMSGGVEAEGDGLGVIPMDLVEDPAKGGEAVEAAPELHRSLEAMAISPQSDKGETELSKDKNNSYAGMVSSVKPDSGKEGEGREGEGEVGGKQGKGISIKEYFTGKLTPGEDERALSELITEGGQSKKNAAVEVPPPEKTGYEEGGRGVGVMGKIRDTITSFLGGGESSPKSPATEARRKVAEDDNVFLRRTPEATSHEKV